MDIRDACADDAPILAQLCTYVQAWHVGAYPHLFKADPDPAALTAFFREILEMPDHTVFLAHLYGRPAGYLWANLRARPDGLFQTAHRDLYIEHVCVAPFARRAGIGTALFATARTSAKQLRCGGLQLDTYALNTQAQAFFTAQGFAIHRLLYRANAE